MPLPFLPLLGGMVRSMGAGILTGFGGRAVGGRLAKAFTGEDAGASSSRVAFESARLAGAFASLGAAALGTTKALGGIATFLTARRQEMVQFNSAVAAAFAQIERQAIRLGVRTAAGAEGSTVGLTRAFMDLRETQQPWEEIGVRMRNLIGIGAARLSSTILGMFGPLAEGIEYYLDKIEKHLGLAGKDGKGFQGEARQFFRQYSRGNWGNPYNREPGDDR